MTGAWTDHEVAETVAGVRLDTAGSAGQFSVDRGLPMSAATTMDAMRRRVSRQPVKSSGSMLS